MLCSYFCYYDVAVEVRIVPTFQVVASFGLLNSFSGLTLPLLASATGTFLFRQFYKTVPQELVDAAKLDGAGLYGSFLMLFCLYLKCIFPLYL